MEVARANNGRWLLYPRLAEVWQAKGKQAMNWTADNQPAVFFATCARLLPNDVRVTVEQSFPAT